MISRVSDDNASRLSYLGERGLTPGSRVRVAEVRDLDGVVLVEDAAGESFSLGAPLARAILVESP